jgi:hypothetical protein
MFRWQLIALAGLIVFSVLAYKSVRTPSEVWIEKVKDPSTDTNGLRFYRPAQYLLVTADKDKNISVSVIALPDKSQEYQIRVKSGWSKIDLKATLEGGWNLTSVGATTESQAPAMLTVLGGLTTAAMTRTVPDQQLEPGLYRIIFDEQSGAASRLEAVAK